MKEQIPCCHPECKKFASWRINQVPVMPDKDTASCDEHVPFHLDQDSDWFELERLDPGVIYVNGDDDLDGELEMFKLLHASESVALYRIAQEPRMTWEEVRRIAKAANDECKGIMASWIQDGKAGLPATLGNPANAETVPALETSGENTK